jgi:signal peptidase II
MNTTRPDGDTDSLRLAKRSALRVLIGTLAAVLVIDQLTKTWSVNALSPTRSIDLPLGVSLVHARNTGVAFSKGSGVGAIILPIIVVIGLISWTARNEFRQEGGPNRWAPLGYGLILGGAFGNVIDRLFRDQRWGRGAVVDMIDVGWWPVFNIADAALSVGVVLTLLTLVSSPRRKPSTRAESGKAQETP